MCGGGDGGDPFSLTGRSRRDSGGSLSASSSRSRWLSRGCVSERCASRLRLALPSHFLDLAFDLVRLGAGLDLEQPLELLGLQSRLLGQQRPLAIVVQRLQLGLHHGDV